MQSTETDPNSEPPDPPHLTFPGVSEQITIGSLPFEVGFLCIWQLSKSKK